MYDKPKRERSLLITLPSPLLFRAPDIYLQEIEKQWTDKAIFESDWKDLVTKLLGQWESMILWVQIHFTL
jgi:hypothetical protein